MDIKLKLNILDTCQNCKLTNYSKNKNASNALIHINENSLEDFLKCKLDSNE